MRLKHRTSESDICLKRPRVFQRRKSYASTARVETTGQRSADTKRTHHPGSCTFCVSFFLRSIVTQRLECVSLERLSNTLSSLVLCFEREEKTPVVSYLFRGRDDRCARIARTLRGGVRGVSFSLSLSLSLSQTRGIVFKKAEL